MEIFNYGCLVTAASSQTRHNTKADLERGELSGCTLDWFEGRNTLFSADNSSNVLLAFGWRAVAVTVRR
jgi:hypothetical protein